MAKAHHKIAYKFVKRKKQDCIQVNTSKAVIVSLAQESQTIKVFKLRALKKTLRALEKKK